MIHSLMQLHHIVVSAIVYGIFVVPLGASAIVGIAHAAKNL